LLETDNCSLEWVRENRLLMGMGAFGGETRSQMWCVRAEVRLVTATQRSDTALGRSLDARDVLRARKARLAGVYAVDDFGFE
jgi:hypothetical protein